MAVKLLNKSNAVATFRTTGNVATVVIYPGKSYTFEKEPTEREMEAYKSLRAIGLYLIKTNEPKAPVKSEAPVVEEEPEVEVIVEETAEEVAESDNYESLTKAQLIAICNEKAITLTGKETKAQLIEALRG